MGDQKVEDVGGRSTDHSFVDLVEVMMRSGLVSTTDEARLLISGGRVCVNGYLMMTEDLTARLMCGSVYQIDLLHPPLLSQRTAMVSKNVRPL